MAQVSGVSPTDTEAVASVVPSLQDTMHADLVITDDGQVCIFHDKPLDTRLEYVEFNADTGQLVLVLRWGVLQPFGELVPLKFRKDIAAAEDIFVIYRTGGEMKDFYLVNLVKQDEVEEV